VFLPDEDGSSGGDARRILVAAATVLERTSYRSLKIRQVLTTAGIATSTFYRHFSGKTDLMLALLREEALARLAELDVRLDAAQSPRDELVAWIDHSVSIATDPIHHGQAKVYTDPLLLQEAPVQLAELTELLIMPLVGVIERGVAAGVFASDDPKRDARALYHVVRGELTDVLAGVRARTPADVRDDLVGFAIQALGLSDGNSVPGG